MDLTPDHPASDDDRHLVAPTADHDRPADVAAESASQPGAVAPVAPPPASAPGESAGGPGIAVGGSAATPRSTGREIGGRKFRVNSGDQYVPFRSRTKRRRRAIALGLVGLLALGTGAYGVVTLIGSGRPAAGISACPAAAAAHAAARPLTAPPLTAQQITVNVYNSTNRRGLAAATAAALKQRGFTIGKVANDPLNSHVANSAQVRGGSADLGRMKFVAAEVPGAELQPDTRADQTVDLVLGAGFSALADPAQAASAQNLAAAPLARSASCHA